MNTRREGGPTLEEMISDAEMAPEPGHDEWVRRQVQKVLDDKKAGKANYRDLREVAAEFGIKLPARLHELGTDIDRMTTKPDFAFFHPLRVRWAECDGQGIVFNANYFAFYDHAIWEWTRALGFKTWDAAPQFVTAHAECDFKGAARFDDELLIGVRAARFGVKSMEVAAAIFRGDALLNVGKLNYVYVEPGTTNPAPLPGDFIDRVTAFERVKPARKV